MEQEKKTVLVTGGAGFIGSHLCEALLKEGNRVICIDDFSTGNVRNIDPYLRNPDFQFLRQDINEVFDIESFPELEPFKVKFLGIQEIYHLAVPMSIKSFDAYRVQTVRASSVGTAQILEMAVKYKSKILLGSSAVIYGKPTAEVNVFNEQYQGVVDHLSERACYDEGRRFAETLFKTYADVYGIDAKIARIFRTYGPRMSLFDAQLISDFVTQALANEPVVIHGDESFTTSVIYVSDVVTGMLKLMRSPQSMSPLNIGSDAKESVKEIAERIIAAVGSKSEVTYAEKLTFLSDLGLPDLTKAKEQMGWMPVVRLEDGLAKTIDYIRANQILLSQE